MRRNLFLCSALAWLALSTLNVQLSTAFAQGTAFTYQGRLQNNGAPASGTYNLTFSLFSASSGGAPVAGPVTTNGVVVTNGLFTVLVDFGPGVFTGAANWLELSLETNLAASFTTVTPRQLLTPAPYAIYSENAGAAGTAATADGVGAGSVTAAGIASGQVVKSLNGLSDAVTLSAGANITLTPSGNTLTIASTGAGSAWSLTGNSGTVPGVNFLGTTDNEPLELRVNSLRGMRLEPTANDANHSGIVNVVNGASSNFAAPGVYGATISGGGAGTYFAQFTINRVTADFGTVGGGAFNTSSNSFATVGGGQGNLAGGYGALVGSGQYNIASGFTACVDGGAFNYAYADWGVIGGGQNNIVNLDALFGCVAGGTANQVNAIGGFVGGGGYDGTNTAGNNASGAAATVAGGLGNIAGNTYAAVSGGISNNASGLGAFVGGGGFDGATVGGNTASGGASTVAGGWGNLAGNTYSTVGGGYSNSSFGYVATIPGGFGNTASGNYSFAAGKNAAANDPDSFVWGDGSRAAVSQGANTFTVLATGGAYFYTTASGVNVAVDYNGDLDFGTATRQMINLYSSTYGIGVQNDDEYFRTAGEFYWYLGGTHNDGNGNAGGGTQLMGLDSSGNLNTRGSVIANGVLLMSDRNAKENFAAVNPQMVLAKVASLPVTEWNYKSGSKEVRHIGPMAQDFQTAFGMNGGDDRHISMVDEGGVALAAIQGLNQKLEQKETEISELKARLEKLEQLMNSRSRDAK